ncbi:MAG: 50S ribosomal protein L10 [Verrucomicrobiales bacterium]
MQAEKQFLIDELLARLEKSPYLFVADYTGLQVKHFAELRKRLKEVGAKARVLKNTLVKRTLKSAGLPELADVLTGQTMVVTGEGEAPAAAKVLKNFAAEFQKPALRGGVLDGNALGANELKALADLPSREQLLATLLGVINAPATKLLRTINEPAAALARVIQARADQG